MFPVQAEQCHRSDDHSSHLGVVVQLLESGRNVSSHILELEMRILSCQLGNAADAACPDDATLGQVTQCLVAVLFDKCLFYDEDVARILAYRDGSENGLLGERGRNVLERMDDDIDVAALEALLELGGPDTLAVKVMKSGFDVSVAGGRRSIDTNGIRWKMRLKGVFDKLGLNNSKSRVTSANFNDISHRVRFI